MLEAFDRWINRGDFTARGLAYFRIFFATMGLLLLPNFHWVSNFPDSMFAPPPGPMSLFSGFPSEAVFRSIELALAISCVALLVGWRTRWASVAFTSLCLLGYGFSYSLGKIDHTILLVICPLFMQAAGWGNALSFDSSRHVGKSDVKQWPIRLFAMTVGLAFLSAAAAKVAAGWLNPETHAVQGTMFTQYFVHARDQYLASTFVNFNNDFFWESLDYFTIAFEGLFILTVVSWRLVRMMCAVATLFHLGVFLMMNIAFDPNIIIYSAFALWDRAPLLKDLPSEVRVKRQLGLPVSVVGGVFVFLVVTATRNAEPVLEPLLVIGGAAAGSAYLAYVANTFLKSRKTETKKSVQTSEAISLTH